MARRHAGQGHADRPRPRRLAHTLADPQNAPAPVEGHIYGLLGMLDHVEYLGRTGETGRMHAERALRFDPSDRFASAVLDTAPTADGSTGLAELADIAQDRGTIR